MKEYELVIEYDREIVRIPFEDIKDIDEFTTQFDTRNELFSFLDRCLVLKAKRKDLFNIYIKHTYIKRNDKHRKVTERLDIKYNQDNYEKSSVLDNYIKYYCDDPRRILEYGGIKYVNHAAIDDYKNGGNKLTSKDIALAVMAYFRNGSYKNYRDAYFKLKKAGYKIKTNPEKQTIDKKNLNYYDISNSYIATLVNEVNLGHIDNDTVIDELAGMDMEELKREVNSKDYGLFDGMGIPENKKLFDSERIMALTELSKKSLEELLRLVEDYRQEYSKGPKR